MENSFYQELENANKGYRMAMYAFKTAQTPQDKRTSLLHALKYQYMLSKLTTGEAQKEHMGECERLTKEISHLEALFPDINRAVPQPVEEEQPAQEAKPAPQPQTPAPQPAAPSPARQDGAAANGKAAAPARDDLEGFDPLTLIVSDPPTSTFENFDKDDPAVKEAIKIFESAIRYKSFPNLAAQMDNARYNNLLLYGPPGTGKTHFFRAAANFCFNNYENSATFIVETKDIQNKYPGVSQRRISALFEAARKFDFAVICFDEIVDLMPSSAGHDVTPWQKSITDQFQMEIDGFHSSGNIVIISATNYPWNVEKAVLSRFPHQAYLGLPNAARRVKFFEEKKQFIGATPEEQQRALAFIGEKTEYMDYRQLLTLKQRIQGASFEKTISTPPVDENTSTFIPLTIEELEKLLSGIQVSYDSAYIKRLEDKEHWFTR